MAETSDPKRKPPTWRPPGVLLAGGGGLLLAFLFGRPIVGAAESFWTGVVLPAFYNLSQSGLPFCG